MNRRSTQTRLRALEKQHPKAERSYHLLALFAKLDLIDHPEMELVERGDTDAETFHSIRATVARAHERHSEADRLQAMIPARRPAPVKRRPGDHPVFRLPQLMKYHTEVEGRRWVAARGAALAAAKARIAREQSPSVTAAPACRSPVDKRPSRPRKQVA